MVIGKERGIRVLVTGGSGFIGHHVVDKILRQTDWDITLIDRLDSSGNLNRLSEIGCPNKRVTFKYHDLRAEFNNQLMAQIGFHDYIIHIAALTHVDRSIESPMCAVMDNVVATCNILEFARHVGCKKFLYFSTDEVFGPAPEGIRYSEWDRYNSGNPYSATKAGAEELCLAFHNTYGVPVFITHTMNVFGERQHPEKFIPMVIGKVRDGERISIHADKSKTKAGSRFYIHAETVAEAVLFLLERAASGDKYNIVGDEEVDNLQLAKMIAEIQKKPLLYEMVDFHSSRPGHDLRYALDGSKMKAMGWNPKNTFDCSLNRVVEWSLKNNQWLISHHVKGAA